MIKTYFLLKIEIFLRKLAEIKSKSLLQKNKELWTALQEYLQKTKSTGCGYIDYAFLYKIIRTYKPVEILECGTGVSTLIIAHALKENDKQTGRKGRVTSMEEEESWFNMSRDLICSYKSYKKYIDLRLSCVIEDSYSIFRGVRYKDIPKRNYDFVFVDGPKYISPVDGASTFNFDYIHLLRKSNHPIRCLIDKRVSTVFVLQQLLGCNKVKYSKILGLGFVSPSSCYDLGIINKTISSKNFNESFSLLKNSKLMITSNK
jgi:predicted O-methyltransferase YrrM